MTYTEITGDLFELPNVEQQSDGYYFVHYIASDLAMGAGIAVPMAINFDLRNRLERLSEQIRRHPCTLITGGVLNMITKEFSSGKPTYENFIGSLRHLRNICEIKNIHKLAMPKIGCGLDGLDWEIISRLIQGILGDLPIEVVVVNFQD